MKRYLVFEVTDYYPAGGMDDCTLKTNSYTQAVATVRQSTDYAYIYDAQEDRIIGEEDL